MKTRLLQYLTTFFQMYVFYGVELDEDIIGRKFYTLRKVVEFPVTTRTT